MGKITLIQYIVIDHRWEGKRLTGARGFVRCWQHFLNGGYMVFALQYSFSSPLCFVHSISVFVLYFIIKSNWKQVGGEAMEKAI